MPGIGVGPGSSSQASMTRPTLNSTPFALSRSVMSSSMVTFSFIRG